MTKFFTVVRAKCSGPKLCLCTVRSENSFIIRLPRNPLKVVSWSWNNVGCNSWSQCQSCLCVFSVRTQIFGEMSCTIQAIMPVMLNTPSFFQCFPYGLVFRHSTGCLLGNKCAYLAPRWAWECRGPRDCDLLILENVLLLCSLGPQWPSGSCILR